MKSRLLLVTFIFPFALMETEQSTFQKYIEEAILIQANFCSEHSPSLRNELEQKITLLDLEFEGTPFKMYVYKENDITSSNLLTTGIYMPNSLKSLSALLAQYKEKNNIKNPSEIGLLDIGANIGYFALALGSKGYRIYAFESMKDNIYLLRKSLCVNPQINAFIMDKAIGDIINTCGCYSRKEDIGNSVYFCNEMEKRFFYRNLVDVYRLDDFKEFLENVIAVRINVKGNEARVFNGGKGVIFDGNMEFIQVDFENENYRKRLLDPIKVLTEFDFRRYKILIPAISTEFIDIKQIKTTKNINQIILIHSS